MVKSTEWVSRGWELVSANIWPHVLLALLVWLASGLSGGLLVPALACGWFYILLRQLREPGYQAQVGDVGQGFGVFGHALLAGILLYVGIGLIVAVVSVASLILSIIPIFGWILGSLLGSAVGILIGPFLLFIFPLIMDRRMDFWPAIEVSFKLAARDYMGFIGLSALFWLLNMAGGLCCGIGALISTPVVMAATAVAYLELFAPGAPGAILADAVPVKVPPAPPVNTPPAAPPPPQPADADPTHPGQ